MHDFVFPPLAEACAAWAASPLNHPEVDVAKTPAAESRINSRRENVSRQCDILNSTSNN
jgi:hypothetical protein